MYLSYYIATIRYKQGMAIQTSRPILAGTSNFFFCYIVLLHWLLSQFALKEPDHSKGELKLLGCVRIYQCCNKAKINVAIQTLCFLHGVCPKTFGFPCSFNVSFELNTDNNITTFFGALCNPVKCFLHICSC